MIAGFMLPSCNYNIVLSEEDLQTLLTKGSICVTPDKNFPCITGRAIWNEKTKDLETLDEKSVPNNLRFFLEEDVADLEGGDWHVQFLTINLERKPKKEHPCHNCQTGWGMATSVGFDSCHATCDKLAEFNKEKSK